LKPVSLFTRPVPYWHGIFNDTAMRNLFFLLLLSYTACTLPEKKKENQLSKKPDTTVIETNDAYTAATDTSNSISLPTVRRIKTPLGIYRAVLPLNDDKMEQIVSFNKDLTYELQEKYFAGKKDSIVITEGTWTPSDGLIWLYKDQIVRGRYKWKGDTLQYFSPLVKRSFSMNHLQDAIDNAVWRNKGKQGIVVFGLGNEPFWNVELDNKDLLSFLLSDWARPVRMKIDSSFNDNDGVAYTAHSDSVQILVTVFPHFCNDGMSDFIYRNKIKVQYNQQTYNGCAIVYK
jgi:uncharacterized membrane protein